MDEKNSKEIQDNGNQTRSLLSSQPNASASVATSSQHQHRTPPPHNISPASHMEEEKKSVSQVVIVEDGDDEKEQVSSSCPAPQSSSQSPSPPQRQSPSTTSPNNLKSAQKNDLEDDARFVCNICLDPVNDAVVTVCGHLYCWPCLFRWLNIGHTTCPVCKAGVTKENVIPLYLQGADEDPRVKHGNSTGGSSSSAGVPNRPSAQRPAPQPTTAPGHGGMPFTAAGGVGGGGMAFSAGLGFFPSLFGLQFL